MGMSTFAQIWLSSRHSIVCVSFQRTSIYGTRDLMEVGRSVAARAGIDNCLLKSVWFWIIILFLGVIRKSGTLEAQGNECLL